MLGCLEHVPVNSLGIEAGALDNPVCCSAWTGVSLLAPVNRLILGVGEGVVENVDVLHSTAQGFSVVTFSW